MRDGLIATIKVNDAVTLTIEYEGDLTELFEKIDDVWKAYDKVMVQRYPQNSVLKKLVSEMFGYRLWKRSQSNEIHQ